MQQATIAPTTFLRLPHLIARLGLSGTTIWRMRRRGEFPQPVRLSPGCIGWRERDVEAWIAQRAEAGR